MVPSTEKNTLSLRVRKLRVTGTRQCPLCRNLSHSHLRSTHGRREHEPVIDARAFNKLSKDMYFYIYVLNNPAILY